MAELNIFQQVSKQLAIGQCMKIDCASIFDLLSTNFQYLKCWFQMLVSINYMHLIKLQIPQRTITFSIIAEFSRCKIFPWPASEQHPRSETRAATSEAGPGYLFSEAELHSQYRGETTEKTYIHKTPLTRTLC